MQRRPGEPDQHAGVDRGIRFSLKRNAAPGYWRYAYAFGDRVVSGRVQMRIDRDMRGGRTDG